MKLLRVEKALFRSLIALQVPVEANISSLIESGVFLPAPMCSRRFDAFDPKVD